MSKLAAILHAPAGWDHPESQPADRSAVAHYLAWAATIPADRAVDAEPMLTDEGHIRMEWERGGCDHTVEIGATTLWMHCMAPDPADDRDAEVEFDRSVLDTFFTSGDIA